MIKNEGGGGALCDQYPHYAMTIAWDPQERISIVTVPELPSCQTHGRTYEEAVRQGQVAIKSWVDVAREDGEPIPEPRLWAEFTGP
jgi:predicted RNase H-like HicB family nuclease